MHLQYLVIICYNVFLLSFKFAVWNEINFTMLPTRPTISLSPLYIFIYIYEYFECEWNVQVYRWNASRFSFGTNFIETYALFFYRWRTTKIEFYVAIVPPNVIYIYIWYFRRGQNSTNDRRNPIWPLTLNLCLAILNWSKWKNN